MPLPRANAAASACAAAPADIAWTATTWWVGGYTVARTLPQDRQLFLRPGDELPAIEAIDDRRSQDAHALEWF